MDEHTLRVMLEGGGGSAGRLLRALLWLPGTIYGTAMRARRAGYERGWFAAARAGVPVISIGNLTAGGSGKTPFTAMLAGHLAARGRKPAILLRGYRRTGDGQSDEAILYGALCPGIPVEVDPDRVAGAGRAVAAGADLLLLDDGFQHLRLRRDLDIVLIDALSPWGGGNTIPGGLLREPPAALSRARIVVVTRSDQVEPAVLAGILTGVRRLSPGARVFTARHRPARLYDLRGTPLPLDSLQGRRVVTLSGIARPEAFEKTVASLGADIVATFRAGDHRRFSQHAVMEAVGLAQARSAVVVATEKDWAKNIIGSVADNKKADNATIGRLIWVMGVEQDVEDREALFALIEEAAGFGTMKPGGGA